MSVTQKSASGRAMDVLSLAVVFAVLYIAVNLGPELHGAVPVIGALGFLLLAGTLTAEILEVVRLPHLTGYLVAGILGGPHVLALIDADSVKRLAPVNTLALALIALAGGAELRLEQLRSGLKSLTLATVVQNVLVLVAVSGVFVAVRPLIPFAREMPLAGVVAVALLWGVIATTRSPSSTLGILSQTHARGPLTSFSLAFVMLSDVVAIVLVAFTVTVARSLLEPGATLSFASFHALGHELLGSVAFGTTLGLVLAVYMRVWGGQLPVVLLALGFGATEILHYVNLEPLLTFLVAGFVVQNLSRQGDKFLHAIEGMGAIVYVVFFAIAGADLDIPLLRRLWPVALLLAVVRAAVTYGAAQISGRLAKDSPLLRKWSWAPLIAQAGLTQGLANLVEREFPSFGAPFRALAYANIALNAIVGPILFKVALERAKEVKAPAPSLEDVASEGEAST